LTIKREVLGMVINDVMLAEDPSDGREGNHGYVRIHISTYINSTAQAALSALAQENTSLGLGTVILIADYRTIIIEPKSRIKDVRKLKELFNAFKKEVEIWFQNLSIDDFIRYTEVIDVTANAALDLLPRDSGINRMGESSVS
jgi:hypothetical protein